MIQRSSGGGGPRAPAEDATANLAPPGLAAAVVSGNLTRYPVEALAGTVAGRAG